MRFWVLLLRMFLFCPRQNSAVESVFTDCYRYCAVLVVFLGNVPGEISVL
jgi:hypothetical protein